MTKILILSTVLSCNNTSQTWLDTSTGVVENTRTTDDGTTEFDAISSLYLEAAFSSGGVNLTAGDVRLQKRLFKRSFKKRLADNNKLTTKNLKEIYAEANTASVLALTDAGMQASAELVANLNLVAITYGHFSADELANLISAGYKNSGLPENQMETYIEKFLSQVPAKYADTMAATMVSAGDALGITPEKSLEFVAKHIPDRGQEFLAKAIASTAAVIEAGTIPTADIKNVVSALESSNLFKNADATRSAILDSFRQSVTSTSETSSSTTTATTTAVTTVAAPITPTVSVASETLNLVTGVAMTAVTPTGTNISSCAVAPTLPAGLTLDTTTCAISGTPTAPQALATYTITVTNATSNLTATATMQIAVLANSPSISYSASSLALTNVTPMTPQTPVVSAGTGGTIQSITVSPDLPAGLAISSTTGVISGTPTAPSEAATYTVTVANSFKSAATTLEISVTEDFIDDNATNFAAGSLVGVEYSSGNLQLATDTDCDGNMSEGESADTNCMKHDPSWTPHYADIIAYYDMETSSDVINGTAFADTTNVTFDSTSTRIGAQSAAISTTSVLDISTAASDFQIGTGDFSLAFWGNYNLGGDGSDLGFQWLSSDNNDGFKISIGTGSTRLVTVNSGATTNYTGTWVLEDSWVHYAIVRTGGTMAIYLNGVFLDSGSETMNITTLLAGEPIELSPSDPSGYIDEFAFWDVALTADEVAHIYQRQVPSHSGYLTSRVIDAGSAGNAWDAIGWQTDLPYLKKLPGDADGDSSPTDDSEGTDAYSALPTTTLQTGMVAYYGQEETSGALADTSSVADSSGLDDHLAVSGTSAVSRPALFGNSTWLDASSAFGGATQFGKPTEMTYAFWFYPLRPYHASTVYEIIQIGGHFFKWRRYQMYTDNKQSSWGQGMVNHNEEMTNTGWRHFAIVSDDDDFVKMYIDGVEVGEDTDLTGIHWLAENTMFMDNTGVAASMDELTIWNRVLSSDEILSLYRRGANRVLLQFRICTAADCSDNPRWLSQLGDPGADQSTQGLLSELLNSTPGSPTVTFSDYAALSGLVTGRYFQYRIILETNNTTYSPKVSKVTISP